VKKAAYILSATDEQIDAIIQHIDELLIAAYNMPPATVDWPLMPTFDRIVEILERYHSQIDCLLVPVWFQNWYNLPTAMQFVDRRGVHWTKTPCPTSIGYFTQRFDPIHELRRAGLIKGVIWDIEDYAAPGVMKFFSKKKMPRCHCSRCKRYEASDISQFSIFENQWFFAMLPFRNVGYTPYSSEWVRGLFGNDATWYCKKTYMEYHWWRLFIQKLKGMNAKSSAGIWLEYHSPNKLEKYVKKVMSKKPFHLGKKFDGVWYYTQRYLFGDEIEEYHQHL